MLPRGLQCSPCSSGGGGLCPLRGRGLRRGRLLLAHGYGWGSPGFQARGSAVAGIPAGPSVCKAGAPHPSCASPPAPAAPCLMNVFNSALPLRQSAGAGGGGAFLPPAYVIPKGPFPAAGVAQSGGPAMQLLPQGRARTHPAPLGKAEAPRSTSGSQEAVTQTSPWWSWSSGSRPGQACATAPPGGG